MNILDLPDDSWVRPRDARAAYNIPQGTYNSWNERGRIRIDGGRGPASRCHLGDFRACVAKRGQRPDRFSEPVPEGRCNHMNCTNDADPDSPINMCPKHMAGIESKREDLRQHRCIQCQTTLPRTNKGLRCMPCGVAASKQSYYKHHEVLA